MDPKILSPPTINAYFVRLDGQKKLIINISKKQAFGLQQSTHKQRNNKKDPLCVDKFF